MKKRSDIQIDDFLNVDPIIPKGKRDFWPKEISKPKYEPAKIKKQKYKVNKSSYLQ